jgi:hypothetical protein
MSEDEVWRPLKGIVKCGENYEVSSYGRIRNVTSSKVLKAGKDNYGYFRVSLHYKGKAKTYQVHRLVTLTFIPAVKDKNIVNHKDGVKTNNKTSNLEWVNNSENQLHAIRIGLVDIDRIREHARELGKKYGGKGAPKPVAKYDLNGNLIEKYPSQLEAAKSTGVLNTTISMQCTHLSMPRYTDFYFRYVEEE